MNADEGHDFGPLQMWTVAFDGSRFKGEILPEFERLKKAGIVRIIDMLAVRKDETGAVAVLAASDLEWEEATQFGAYLGTLIGFGTGGPDGAARGAISGAAELADGHLFNDEDTQRLMDIVPAGSTIAIILLEHLWTLPLLHAVDRADGIQLHNDWVSIDRLVEAQSPS